MRNSCLLSVEERAYWYQRKERTSSVRVGVDGWVRLLTMLLKRMAMWQEWMESEEGRMMGKLPEMEEGGEDPGIKKVNEVNLSSKAGGWRPRLQWRNSQL